MPLEAPLAVRLNFGNLLPKGKDIKIDTTVYQKDSKGTTLGCFLQAVPKNCYAIIRHLSDTSEERPEEKLILTATSSFGPSVLPSTLRCCASDIDVCCCLPCLMAIGQRCLDILRHVETCWDTCFNSEMELGCIASKELLGQCASSWLWSASSDHTRRTSETTTRISSNQPEPDTKGRSLQDAILSESVRIRSLPLLPGLRPLGPLGLGLLDAFSEDCLHGVFPQHGVGQLPSESSMSQLSQTDCNRKI
jgi:hypothetical protein